MWDSPFLAGQNSKFSDLLVLMDESTPKKVLQRNSVCRHSLRVFGRAGKAGSDKNLASKIRNVCGIFITESDSLSTLICRKRDSYGP